MAAVESSTTIESPCNKTCAIDSASGLCVGCGRTLAEIESWLRRSDRERARIMMDLPRRLLQRIEATPAT